MEAYKRARVNDKRMQFTGEVVLMSKANMVKLFQDLSYRHNLWTVFSDFLEMTAVAIRNSVNVVEFNKYEDRFKGINKKYSEKEQAIFPKLYAELVAELEHNTSDVLGELFMELELGNKWKGQFFTPFSICLLTAEVIYNDSDIDKKGFITLNEPAVGGGAMVIAYAEVMKMKGYNPQEQLKVVCQDLDIKSVYMSYIQLSLLGIPAVVYHGNTLTLEMFEAWKTPMWILGGWSFKKPSKIINLKEVENGQLSFI